MYGVMVMFKFKGPLSQEQIDVMTEKVIEPLTHESGFCHFNIIADEEGKVGVFHQWESKDQAEEAVALTLTRLQPLVTGLLEEPPTRIMSEILISYDSSTPAGEKVS